MSWSALYSGVSEFRNLGSETDVFVGEVCDFIQSVQKNGGL